MNNSDLKRDNAQYLWHPMAHPKAMKADGGQPDIIARGEGCYVWDIDGHKLLDGVAGLWSCNLGHSCRPVRDAVVAQLDELPFFNTFRGTTHPRAIELSRALVELMRPDGVAAVMFSNGGSDAVEGALKLARQCHKLRGDKDRSYIPLGATAISARVANVSDADATGAGLVTHGYTYPPRSAFVSAAGNGSAALPSTVNQRLTPKRWASVSARLTTTLFCPVVLRKSSRLYGPLVTGRAETGASYRCRSELKGLHRRSTGRR